MPSVACLAATRSAKLAALIQRFLWLNSIGTKLFNSFILAELRVLSHDYHRRCATQLQGTTRTRAAYLQANTRTTRPQQANFFIFEKFSHIFRNMARKSMC